MQYSSVARCMTYTQWAVAIAIGLVTFRCIDIVIREMTSLEGNTSLSHALDKVKNHVKALVIAVVAEGIIQWIKGYFL